jgi:RHS repeat-associated protein
MYDAKGKVTWETELDIYGKVRKFAGSSLSDCPFRYQGQYFDEEIGLYYNRFRYYSPEEGIYISQDPIGLNGGLNVYAYVHNPNSWVDVFGLELVRVYHYTGSDGYKGIMGTGTIKISDPSARGVGSIPKPKGVYVTTISPENLQSSGKRGQMGLTKNKSTHYVSFEIDDSKLKWEDPQSDLRLRISEDVNLRDEDNKLRSNVKHGEVPCKS